MNATTTVTPQEKPKAREYLSRDEKNELAKQEKFIEIGFLHMRNCAEALRVIRDKRLYRAQFDTFQEYCERKWKRERQTIDLMLAAFEVRKQVETALVENDKNFCQIETAKSLLTDTSDHALRELGKVEPENRIKVFERAVEQSNGAPTAKAIQKAEEDFSLLADGPPRPAKEPKRKRQIRSAQANRAARRAKSARKALQVPVYRVLETFDAVVEKNLDRWRTVADAIAGIRKALERL